MRGLMSYWCGRELGGVRREEEEREEAEEGTQMLMLRTTLCYLTLPLQ
jgi:hypothetical protein